MSGLANSLANLQAQVNSEQECGVSRIKKELDKEDRAALDSVLRSAASTRQIHKALRQNGYVIDRTLLQMHRRGLCSCAKDAF